MENRAFGALAAVLLLCCAYCAPAVSEPLRVLYAEPFQAQTASTPGVQKLGPANLRVHAFGRTFELELEDNSRLLREVSLQTRERIGAVQLLKGKIKDAPGSWVRLTLRAGLYTGAFWDGSELYAIESRERLEAQLLVPMPAAATGIYRLSDTQGGLFQGRCALETGTSAPANPTAKFRALIRELQTATVAAPREIEISMIGDFEFTSAFGAAAVSAMVERMNVVDGIFASQVGVTTIPTDFITFTSDTDPFTATEAVALLNQLADYRDSTPLARSRGLAHLLTGRELDGNPIGIGFLGTLCRAREGSSLSQWASPFDSALTIAHELGHNFGAPHDNERGSPCATTPRSFIMAPELSFSSTFSTCSLQQMQPHIDAASCVVAARNRDMAVSAPAEVQAFVNESFDYVVDAVSAGEVDALNAVLTVEVPQPQLLQVLSTTMAGVTCTTPAPGTVRCDLGDVAAGQTRSLTLRLRSQILGDFVLRSAVASTRDIDPANDSRSTTLHVINARAVELTISPQPLTVTTGQPFELAYDVTAVGVFPSRDMRLELHASRLTPLIANADSGTCTMEAALGIVNCVLGDIAVGAPRQVRVQWVTQSAGDISGMAAAFESALLTNNAHKSFLVHVQAQRDIGLATSETFKRTPVGQDAEYSLQVASSGLNTVNDVHVRLSTAPEVTLTVHGPIAASCTTAGPITDCALGAMPPQATRTLQFRARADSVMNTSIQAEVVLPSPDNAPSNDAVSFVLDVRVGNDVAVSANTPPPTLDERSTTIFALAAARGANASENVRLNITMPIGFVVESATFDSQPCTLDPVDRHLASCALARIEPDIAAPLQLQFVAPEAGTRTARIEATCDNDANPANNSRSLSLEVLPNVDARLTTPPAPQRARTDMPVDLVFTVNTNKYALPDARLTFSWFASLVEFSASAPGATCGVSAQGYGCEWTSLPANSAVQVAVRVRSGSDRTSASISAFLESDADKDSSNNSGFVAFPIVVSGDVGVTLLQAAVTLPLDPFRASTVPGIDIVTLSPLEAPFIEVTFDQTRLRFAGIANGSCLGTLAPQTVRCQIPGMELPGTRPVLISVIPQGRPDIVPITIRVGAFNDFNPTNDEQTVTVTIVDPPPPPPPPPPAPSQPSSSGGGGGSMSWMLAALLLAMWQHRRTRVHR